MITDSLFAEIMFGILIGLIVLGVVILAMQSREDRRQHTNELE